MNTQPPEYVGSIAAILFVLMVTFFTFKSYIENTTTSVNDLFTIGYIEDNQSQNITNILYQQPNEIDAKLYLDCVDTLVAVGYKKSAAKKLVTEYFKKNTASNVQEFISKVFQS
jgi:hypothetical protein